MTTPTPAANEAAPADICKPFGYVRDNCGDGHVFQHAPFSESEGLMYSTAEVYSRAQMLSALAASGPAPAASRAATLPADIRALLEACQRWHNGSDWRHDVRIERRLAWQEHGEAIASALAAQPASPAPLTTVDEIMRIARLSEGAFTIQSDKDRRNLIGDVCDALSTILRRHSDAALASPQVAPAPKPVLWVNPEQAAAHTDPSVPADPEWSAKAGRYLPCRRTPAGLFTMPLYAAPVQVAPQDDARDAARYRFLRDMTLNGDEEDFPCIRAADNDSAHWALIGEAADTIVDAAIRAKASLTPAAKPTDPAEGGKHADQA